MAKQQPLKQPQQTQPEQKRKFGQGMAAATLRKGGKELGHYIDAFPQGSPSVDEPGTMFNTPITGISQQTGFAQPVKSAVDQPHVTSIVDQHHHDMVGHLDQGKQQHKELKVHQQVDVSQTSIVDQHHAQMQQQRDIEPPQPEMDQ